MDVREKLVEILKQAPFEGKVLDEWWWEEKIVRIVDHLIAHGVTVQEWISVEDRLPTIHDANADNCVLAIHKVTNRLYYHWRTVVDNPFDFTFWSKVPEPPKGETIYCKDCEHLMFSDCYGECANGHKGIVNPNDTCEHAKRKPPKGE